LDKQKQEELVKLEGTYQELKKTYKDFSKGLVLPKKMDEKISDSLELVNKLQKSINSEAKQEEINANFENLKKKGEEVENDLKKVIKNLKTDSSQEKMAIDMDDSEQKQQTKASSSKNNHQADLKEVIINEHTPLLNK
jgi:hypothetical protein